MNRISSEFTFSSRNFQIIMVASFAGKRNSYESPLTFRIFLPVITPCWHEDKKKKVIIYDISYEKTWSKEFLREHASADWKINLFLTGF